MSAVKERQRPVVRTQVEPRIVERRRRVDDEQAGRRRRVLVVIAAVAVAVVVAIGLLLSPLLDVDRVEVTGADQLTAEQVTELSGIERGSPLVSVDLAAARESLRAHRLVAAARVTRTWPGAVQISVVEEQPSVLLRHGAAETVLSSSGRVLEPSDAQGVAPMFVVVRAGPFEAGTGERVDGALRAAVAMVDQMDPALRASAAQLVVAEDDTVTLDLPDGAEVRVGRLDDVPAKLLAIETALAQVVPECLASLDVTEPKLATVTRVPGCEVPAPTVALEEDPDEAGDESVSTTTEEDDDA